jgi:anti-anti-sigma factor
MATLERIELGNLVVLKLKGSLTSDGLETIEEPFAEIAQRPGGRTVVDLTGVDFVTTPALSMFIAAANSAKQTGGRIIFTETQPPVRDVLNRLRLHAILRTVPGLEEAISHARE